MKTFPAALAAALWMGAVQAKAAGDDKPTPVDPREAALPLVEGTIAEKNKTLKGEMYDVEIDKGTVTLALPHKLNAGGLGFLAREPRTYNVGQDVARVCW